MVNNIPKMIYLIFKIQYKNVVELNFNINVNNITGYNCYVIDYDNDNTCAPKTLEYDYIPIHMVKYAPNNYAITNNPTLYNKPNNISIINRNYNLNKNVNELCTVNGNNDTCTINKHTNNDISIIKSSKYVNNINKINKILNVSANQEHSQSVSQYIRKHNKNKSQNVRYNIAINNDIYDVCDNINNDNNLLINKHQFNKYGINNNVNKYETLSKHFDKLQNDYNILLNKYNSLINKNDKLITRDINGKCINNELNNKTLDINTINFANSNAYPLILPDLNKTFDNKFQITINNDNIYNKYKVFDINNGLISIQNITFKLKLNVPDIKLDIISIKCQHCTKHITPVSTKTVGMFCSEECRKDYKKSQEVYVHSPINKQIDIQFKTDPPDRGDINFKKMGKITSIVNTSEIEKQSLSVITVADIKTSQKQDNQFKLIRRYINSKSDKIKGEIYQELSKFHKKYIRNYVILSDLIYININPFGETPRILIPNTLANDICIYEHNTIHGGHKGIHRFRIAVSTKYWFDNISNITANVVRNCKACNLAKMKPRPSNELIPIIANGFNDHIIIDFKGPLCSNIYGYRYALVYIDVYTGFAAYSPSFSTDATSIIHNILHTWISVFGVPKLIHCDNGNGLNSKEFHSFVSNIGSKIYHGNPYNSKSQGKVERLLREINKALRIYSVTLGNTYINNNSAVNNVKYVDNWCNVLSLYLYEYNNSINYNTGFKPCELLYGQSFKGDGISRHLNDINSFVCANTVQYFEFIRETILFKQIVAQTKIYEQKQRMVKRYRAHNKPGYELKIGQHCAINADKRYTSNVIKHHITNKPNYIIIGQSSIKHYSVRNLINGEVLHGIHQDKIIPISPEPVITNELGSILNKIDTYDINKLDKMNNQELENLINIYDNDKINDACITYSDEDIDIDNGIELHQPNTSDSDIDNKPKHKYNLRDITRYDYSKYF